MVTYDDIFRTRRHIESGNPEPFVWEGVDSVGLAEIMDLAEQKGYSYKLHCHDEKIKLDILEKPLKVRKRDMIFEKKA